jgi:hypothetical protein
MSTIYPPRISPARFLDVALPWAKFFWSDYAADPALRLCSFAAQGLWMRMLCIAAEHEPGGYVAVNGRGLDNQAIARSTGGSVEEVETLLSELEGNGVFSRDRRGWIYSRRLVNDAKRRRKASEAGKLGGNPTLRKQRGKSPTLKGKDKGSLNGEANPHIPEARSQSIETPNGVGETDLIDPQEIVDAWNITADRYGLPKVAKLTDRRRQQLKARIRENTLEDFQKVFAAIGRSPFLRGENKNGWRADFDFVLQPKSFVRMLEGSYDH